ncbi:MAG TPA: 30S ribosomal protein S12 methylthiotransferase RimO [Candidatus Acidoferrum sp.]|jgi:ribosomal protein S12 methylthiotransferase|nr:30S ribosomal protein S12 methylthiotransferase RimO [Candidatus Acidoferrum sp.]
MKREPAARSLKVGLISLGCAKNLVDGEIMLGTLLKDGVEITNQAERADVVIVNTCSFIDSAQEESVDTILESAQVREAKNRGQALVVAGCLPQRFRDELPKLLPEVDAFMGIDQVARVTEIVREALDRRKSKVQSPKSKASRLKSKVQGRRSGSPHHASRIAHHVLPDASLTPAIEVNLRPHYIPDYATPRFRLTPRHFAYVKVAEGCNHPCSFCIIPRMRGSHRSRSQADIVAEAKTLVADGVKELNLISQDSTYYGLDLRPNHSRAIATPDRFNATVKALPAEATTICSLLRELNALPGDFWLRLLYTHPAHWTDELIRTIAECPKVARYVDIPLQHIHDSMLERMRRETSRQYIVDLLRRIRSGVPGIALRTTFIVGFPGETEEYFETLLNFIRATRFERLGVFAYSQEDGTRAGKMAGQLPDKLKRQRRQRAMAVQHEVAAEVSESFVGRAIRVLVEKAASARELKGARISSWEHGLLRGPDEHTARLKGRYLVARGEADAPDIDGRVYVHGQLPPGEFATVTVVGHTDYDLIAEPYQQTT